jgi:hypothetical protein
MTNKDESPFQNSDLNNENRVRNNEKTFNQTLLFNQII